MHEGSRDIQFRPFTVLLGIILGCLFSIAFCTGIVSGIFWLLRDDEPRLAAEMAGLLQITWIFTGLTVAAALGFIGSVRDRTWRYVPLLALWLGLIATGNYYWPG